MPKPATHALTWRPDTSTSTYTVRDPEHDQTLAAIFGDILTFTPGSQEWFGWLASISSFAFEGREGRFTARCETKQRQACTSKWRECSTIFEPKCGNSARMLGIENWLPEHMAPEGACNTRHV